MIQVTLTNPRGEQDVAEADTPENAVFAAQTLFDESCQTNPTLGWRRKLTLTFSVAGKTIWLCEGRRP